MKIENCKLEMGYFGEAGRAKALVREAEGWVGTRFQGHARVQGVGVDCVQLAAALYIETGFLREFEVGWYPIDGGQHDEASRVVSWIEKSGRFARVGMVPPAAGDLLVMKLGRVEHHVGVALGGGLFVHVMFRANVAIEPLGRFLRSITAIYRPLGERSAGAEGLQHVRD